MSTRVCLTCKENSEIMEQLCQHKGQSPLSTPSKQQLATKKLCRHLSTKRGYRGLCPYATASKKYVAIIMYQQKIFFPSI